MSGNLANLPKLPPMSLSPGQRHLLLGTRVFVVILAMASVWDFALSLTR